MGFGFRVIACSFGIPSFEEFFLLLLLRIAFSLDTEAAPCSNYTALTSETPNQKAQKSNGSRLLQTLNEP